MAQPLPAVLIGGPPHAGKSVLTYSLTQALRKRNIAHYALRANPDGEGDWSHEMEQNMVDFVRIKGKWTPEFVTRICADLERRPLPLLVDVGGLPTDDEMCLFERCTHAMLLLHPDKEEINRRWFEIVRINNLPLLARVDSRLSGVSTMTSLEPMIEGTLVGLHRGSSIVEEPLFKALVERIAALFAPTATGLVKTHLDMAPVEFIVNLDTFIQDWALQTGLWKPEMIQRLLNELPADTALAVYGRAPTWLYGALAAYADARPFHQFSSRLGWVVPPPLQISTKLTSELDVQFHEHGDVTVMTINIIAKNLDYFQAEHLPFPAISLDRGLLISGVIPQWLLTALVRLYRSAGVTWIAYHYPQDEENRAVVMFSRTPAHAIGEFVPRPTF